MHELDIVYKELNETLSIKEWIEFETEHNVLPEFYEALSEESVFWDVGAYRGLYSLIASHKIRDGNIISFEPADIPRSQLKNNIDSVSANQVQIVDNPLYSNTEEVEITMDTTSGSRTFIKGTSNLEERDTNKTVTLQAYSAEDLVTKFNIPSPTILKLDVEGGETSILQGFSEEQINKIKDIFVEVHHIKGKDKSVKRFLSKHGFNIEVINERRKSEEDWQQFLHARK